MSICSSGNTGSGGIRRPRPNSMIGVLTDFGEIQEEQIFWIEEKYDNGRCEGKESQDDVNQGKDPEKFPLVRW